VNDNDIVHSNYYYSKLGSVLAAAVILIAYSHSCLDTRIAAFFGAMLTENHLMYSYASDIPDILLPTAILCTLTSWAAYLWLVRKGVFSPMTSFFRLVGWTIPASYLLKTALKDIFGKVTTRAWLANHELYGFHWFGGEWRFDGFPSGHMAVFTVLALAVWRFFPRYRTVCMSLLFLLAASLVVTSYHFLSDVLAGALVGFLIDAVAFNFLFEKKKNKCGFGS
jgi:membrane-associated phospholipid phosphatase